MGRQDLVYLRKAFTASKSLYRADYDRMTGDLECLHLCSDAFRSCPYLNEAPRAKSLAEEEVGNSQNEQQYPVPSFLSGHKSHR